MTQSRRRPCFNASPESRLAGTKQSCRDFCLCSPSHDSLEIFTAKHRLEQDCLPSERNPFLPVFQQASVGKTVLNVPRPDIPQLLTGEG